MGEEGRPGGGGEEEEVEGRCWGDPRKTTAIFAARGHDSPMAVITIQCDRRSRSSGTVPDGEDHFLFVNSKSDRTIRLPCRASDLKDILKKRRHLVYIHFHPAKPA